MLFLDAIILHFIFRCYFQFFIYWFAKIRIQLLVHVWIFSNISNRFFSETDHYLTETWSMIMFFGFLPFVKFFLISMSISYHYILHFKFLNDRFLSEFYRFKAHFYYSIWFYEIQIIIFTTGEYWIKTPFFFNKKSLLMFKKEGRPSFISTFWF